MHFSFYGYVKSWETLSDQFLSENRLKTLFVQDKLERDAILAQLKEKYFAAALGQAVILDNIAARDRKEVDRFHEVMRRPK